MAGLSCTLLAAGPDFNGFQFDDSHADHHGNFTGIVVGQLEISFQGAILAGKNARIVPWFVDRMFFANWVAAGYWRLRRLG